MANITNPKIPFGVVHGAPSQLSSATIEEGKLYFLAGEADGVIKQGIYGVNGVTTDGSIITDYDLAMFGCGSVADGTGYGLSQYNYDSDASTKLKNLHDASSNYLQKSSYVQVSKTADGYVPKADASAGTIDNQAADWVLAFDGSKVDWFKLPTNAFKNDNSIYTGTAPINVSGTVISHVNSGVTAGGYGDTSSARTLEFGGKFKVVDVSVNAFGHVTKAESYELTLPSKPATAGTADEAKKTTGTLTIKGNGSSVGTFNGSAAEEVNIKTGNASTLTIAGTNDGSITITPVTAAVASNSSALTTGAQVAAYVAGVVGELTGALVYKGVVSAANGLPSNASTGWVYVASAGFTYNDGSNDWAVESGDMFIYNGTKWNIVNGENQVENKAASISANGTERDVTIATVDGTDITVKVPAAYYAHPVAGLPTQSLGNAAKNTTVAIGTETKIATVYDVSFDASGHYKGKVARDISIKITSNNTDEKVKANTSTGKFYLIGQDDATSGTTETTYKNASVYADGGYLYSGGAKVLTSYTEKYTGTVTSITPGTGLTGESSDTAITSSGIINLKIASSSEIGGVKPGTTVANNKIYGVQVNASTGEMTVNVPWADNTDEKVKDASGTGKSFILGHTTQGTTATATTNASVYMQSGKMYATSGSVASNDTALVTGGTVHTAVQTAKSEAIEAATIYWETL